MKPTIVRWRRWRKHFICAWHDYHGGKRLMTMSSMPIVMEKNMRHAKERRRIVTGGGKGRRQDVER